VSNETLNNLAEAPSSKLGTLARAAVAGVVSKELKGGLLSIIPLALFANWFKATVSAKELRVERDVDTYVHIEPVLYQVKVQWPSQWGIPAGIKPTWLMKKRTKHGEYYRYQFATRELSDIKRRRHAIKLMADFIDTQSKDREQYR
jgi:hypothetical protein